MEKILEDIKVKKPNTDLLDLLKKDSKANEEKEEYILFKDLERDTYKNNPDILYKYFRNAEGKDCYKACIKSPYLQNKSILEISRLMRKDFGIKVKLYGYKYNENDYRFVCPQNQALYEEDLYMKTKEQEQAEYDAERQLDLFGNQIDYTLFETLYRMIYKALSVNRIMLFQLDNAMSILNNAIDCESKGVSCLASNHAMKAAIEAVYKILTDKESIKFIKEYDDTIFDKNDYIETYCKVLNSIVPNMETYEEAYEFFEDILQSIDIYGIKGSNQFRKVLKEVLNRQENVSLDYVNTMDDNDEDEYF